MMVEDVVPIGMNTMSNVCHQRLISSVCIDLFGAKVWLFSAIPLYWV